MKKVFGVICALLMTVGCATTPISKFNPSSKGASVSEREETYSRYSISVGPLGATKVGGIKYVRPIWNPYGRFKNYYFESGDTISAQLVDGANRNYWTGITVFSLGVVLADILANNNVDGWRSPGPNIVVPIAGLFSIGIVWNGKLHFKNSVESFNHYLKKELELN